MSKKTILIFIIISAILLIISIVNMTLSFKAAVFPFKTATDSESLKKAENDLRLAGDELKKYEYLLDNLNKISFMTIYYGKADTESGRSGHFFTAFSLFYKEKYYLITAGHSIELGKEKYKNFEFKPNNREFWLTPELLYYENDIDNNNDFAIFKDDSIKNGLYPATDDLRPEFVFGNTLRRVNLVKEYDEDISAVSGESGSPVLNSGCKVIGVLIKNKGEYTEIAKVLTALDQLQND